MRSEFRAGRSTARSAICCRRARCVPARWWWHGRGQRPARAAPVRIRSIAGSARSRGAPNLLPGFRDKAGKQRDLTLAVDPCIMRNAEQVGCPKRDCKVFGFRSPDDHAQFWWIESELCRVDAGNLVIAQGPFRPRVAQKRQRGLKPRPELRHWLSLRHAPAALSPYEVPLPDAARDIDLAHLRGWDGEEPVGEIGRASCRERV